jgi:tetratricopeptide (TPR) repeat protein
MPEYLLSARDPKGRKVTECVEADSAEDAVAILREEGYADIVLHTDDVMAAVNPKRRVSKHLTPRDLVELRLAKGYFSRALFLLRKLYATGWKSLLLLLVLVVTLAMLRHSWGMLEWLVIGALVFPVPFALVFALFSGSRSYDRVLEAASWGRWEEVLELLPRMSKRVPPHERALREAQALAGSGRIGEGLALFEPFATNGEIPQWLYWARVAEVYGAARDRSQALVAKEKSLSLAPDNPTILIDVAAAVLWVKGDIRRARELLERAKQYPMVDIAAPFLQTTEALIALETGDAEAARTKLEAALPKAVRLIGGNAVGRVAIDRIHGFLTIAHAQLGNSRLARAHFRRAEPRMRALGWDDLLRRCEHAIG